MFVLNSVTSTISNLLSPIGQLSPNLSRRRSNSSEEMSKPEEIVLTTKENILNPFAKITKGFQNIGASLSDQSQTQSSAPIATEVNVDNDYMKAKMQSSETKTKILLL